MAIWKKILIMLGSILTITIVAGTLYFTKIYNFSISELSKTYNDFRSTETKTLDSDEPFSILLMGVDTGSGDRSETWEGNSDTMILVTVNPQTNTTTMTSLERDILVELAGPEDNSMNGEQAKLNAAYASGGAEMALATVEKLLDITIDKYMMINMQGLVELVDAVGGITVTNDFDFPITIDEYEPDYTASIEPGTHKINGDQALVYARMRYDDPDGDYGRQRRQREVIQLIMQKLLAIDSISNYRSVLSAVSGNMQTDVEITTETIPELLGYRTALENLKSYQLRGEDAMINGGSYQITTASHLLKVQNRIKKQLGLETSETLTTNAYLYETYTGEETDITIEESAGTSQSDKENRPEEEYYYEQPVDQNYYGYDQPAYPY